MAAERFPADVSMGLNLSSWAAAAANLTRYAPSAKDLLLAGPRVGIRVGSYFLAIPDAIDGALGGRLGQRVIPEATNVGRDAATTIGLYAGQAAHMGTAPGMTDTIMEDVAGAGIASRLSIESARSFGNIFSYSTSRWALACVVMAIGMFGLNTFLAVALAYYSYIHTFVAMSI